MKGNLLESLPPASVFGGPGKFAFNPYEQIQLNKLKSYSEYQTSIMSEWGKYIVGDSRILCWKNTKYNRNMVVATCFPSK